MSSGYDAILFDFDGVLADSEPVHWECWRDVLAPIGIELPWSCYAARCIGVSDDEMERELAPLAHGRTGWFPRALAEKRPLFRARAAAGNMIGDGVRNVLSGLSLPLAVVTSSSRLEVEPVLLAAGIHGRFGACVYSESVARRKPDPEPYRTAAAMLGARRPLVVEDSDAGARSAQAAGFDCLRIACPSELADALRARLEAG
jgi:beta-phosphoglucomutase